MYIVMKNAFLNKNINKHFEKKNININVNINHQIVGVSN